MWPLAQATPARAPSRYIPLGGSTALGTLGHVNAALELADQVEAGELPLPGRVVVPLGSGGTAAGLALGFAMAGLDTRCSGRASVHGSAQTDGVCFASWSKHDGSSRGIPVGRRRLSAAIGWSYLMSCTGARMPDRTRRPSTRPCWSTRSWLAARRDL